MAAATLFIVAPTANAAMNNDDGAMTARSDKMMHRTHMRHHMRHHRGYSTGSRAHMRQVDDPHSKGKPDRP
jgi:hypothetical protein